MRAPICAAIMVLAGTATQSADALAARSGLPVPRYVSLKFADVNGRKGPSQQHPIVWRYLRAGLPVRVIAETEGWTRIEDPDGARVWVASRMVTESRAVLIRKDRAGGAALRARPDGDAAVRAVLQPGVVASLEMCVRGWCQVAVARRRGWVTKTALWGVAATGDDGRPAGEG
jgi:SH3-like domain-containing protein